MTSSDPQFRNLEGYILGVTERIWEGREVGNIGRWYADDNHRGHADLPIQRDLNIKR